MIPRRLLITFLLLPALCAVPLAASAATAKKDKVDPRDREFVSACMQAFDLSNSSGSIGIGRQICECTIVESKSQGATRDSVVRETAKIKADPKYKIQDPKLLAAFQVCAIEAAGQEH